MQMDLEVVGRHALLFDDDASAAFVNSNDALVEWNSLSIDRYDVRHLLSAPPPSRRRRNPQQSYASSLSSVESELDQERYLDLLHPPPKEEQESDEDATRGIAGGFHAVPFSYGNSNESNEQKDSESGSEGLGFVPPFPVPESLRQSLPPTEKVHQIIARTAMFVSKHGGQSEIVLRVKQGDNPAFGFLMPDHHLHAYFRFLVDHRDILQSDIDGKPENEKISSTEQGVGGGALSMLGSLYGEDEDGAPENESANKENVSGETIGVTRTVSHGSEDTASPVNNAVKDEAVSRHLKPSKEKTSPPKKKSFSGLSKSGSTNSARKGESFGSLSAPPDKLQASHPRMPKIEPLVLEPPSDIKRLVDKIVDFIMKNGKQFEAVLLEQDSEHGRFPFLLPSNQYNAYYLKVLQNAQESKFSGKNFLGKKDGLAGHRLEKRTSLSKESDTSSLGSADIPYDSDRKEKFKMIIGKSKKDGQDPPLKSTQQQFGVSVDAASAAAILQAATRGIRNPNLGFLSGTPLNGNSHDCSSEGGQASSLGSQPETVIPCSVKNEASRASVPSVKAIAKSAALEAASEADSSEAHLTKEQKLKAERLKRAKMFVSMLKSGAAPSVTEPLRGLSVEPQESGVSGSRGEVNFSAKEREGSSAPLDIDTLEKNKNGKYTGEENQKTKYPGDEYNERRSKRKYRLRSSRDEVVVEELRDDEEKGERKNSSKKHRSHHSSHDDIVEETDSEEMDDKHYRSKHRSYRSSPKDTEKEMDEDNRDHKHSRKKHRSSREEDKEDEDRDRRSRKTHRSHCSSHHSRDGHKHRKRHSSSKDREARHQHKCDLSSDDEHGHHSRADKHRKASQSEREELEEGEISSKISDQSRASTDGASREASVNLPSSYQDRTTPSLPSETAEVSNDLRAKIRAMLMATL